MNDRAAAWTALLDAVDEGLSASPPNVVDRLPPDPGPVPPSLVARAEETLRRMVEAQAALEQHRLEVGRELAALSAAKATAAAATGSSVPHFLDTKV